jgi:hypothetical protein
MKFKTFNKNENNQQKEKNRNVLYETLRDALSARFATVLSSPRATSQQNK